MVPSPRLQPLAAGDHCPLCDQPIPDDRLDEIRVRLEAQQASLATEITSRLREEFARDKASAVELAKRETAREAEAGRAALQEQIKAVEARATSAEGQTKALQETFSAQLTQRLEEQRAALEQARTVAVNAERATAFEKELKLSNKVEELQRALANKTAEELGEGAEIDLYELLKGAFEGDRIERTNLERPGADILHVVIHNGRECGRIVYDSKNHNAWRNDFVTKLASDQMAAKADHAILSTRKFPAGTRHLHVQDGVIIASPSRVAAVVEIVRQHIIQAHSLRLSEEARTQKTAQLYKFMTSRRCRDLFERIDTHTDDLLDLQVKEKKTHEANWKRQGELLRSVQKVRAEICNEIDLIVAAAEVAPDDGDE
jgi:hypothetical protein